MDSEADLLAAAVRRTTEALAVIDSSGLVLYANQACADVLAAEHGSLVGQNIADRVHPDDLHRAVTVVAGVTEGARPRPGLITVRYGESGWKVLEISASPIPRPAPPDGPGTVTMLLLRDNVLQETHWNFMAALSADRPFAECVEVLAIGLSDGPDGPMAINYATAAGSTRDEARLKRSLAGQLPPQLGALTEQDRLDTTPGTPWTIAIESGRPAWSAVEDLPADVRDLAQTFGLAACVAVAVPDPANEVPALLLQWPQWTTMAGLLGEALVRRPHQAMTLALDRRFAMHRLEQLAHHDGLTGLTNRERFFETLAGYDEAGRRYAVYYIDLDRFKPINDTHGHLTGDRVIVECARRLRGLARPGDIVARLGGDEFAIASNDVDDDTVLAMAERIVAELGVPITASEHDVEIGASVGCAVSAPGRDADTVVATADEALYRAKRAGRNRWFRL